MIPSVSLSPRPVSSDDRVGIAAVVAAATWADGVPPLSEHVELDLRAAIPSASEHFVVHDRDGTIAGYAHLDLTDAGSHSAELVVHPGHRRLGLGTALLGAVFEGAGDGLAIWAHGGLPAALGLAQRAGLRAVRELRQMRRTLGPGHELPAAGLPDGVRLRAFRPGEDDARWVRLNALAFAEHREQGRLGLEDLHARMREPWFDPGGFLFAQRAGDPDAPLGYIWTKVHDRVPGAEGQAGEVYAIGVAPQARGLGLARSLVTAGLEHLAGRGLRLGLLYVDADNLPAVGLYDSLGFTTFSTDVMFAR